MSGRILPLAAAALLGFAAILWGVSRGADPEAGPAPATRADSPRVTPKTPAAPQPSEIAPGSDEEPVNGILVGHAFYESTGRPAAGLHISAFLWVDGKLDTHLRNGGYRGIKQGNIGPDGAYRIGRMLPGTWRVGIPHRGKGYEPLFVTIRSAEETRLDATIPRPPGAVVTGVVRDRHSGEAVPGVLLFTPYSPKQRRSGTDLTGHYEMYGLPPGKQRVTAATPGYRWLEKELTVVHEAHEARLDFDLHRTPEVKGRVTGPNGEPVKQARFSTRAQGAFQAKIYRYAKGDGTFLCEVPVGETTRIYAAARGYGLGASEPITMEAVGLQPEVTIRLDPAGSLEGRVRDENGRTIFRPALLVELLAPGGGTVTAQWRGKEDGTLLIPDLIPGPCRIHVTGKGCAPGVLSAVIRPGPDPTKLDIALRAEVPISGFVRTPEGKPVARARIEARAEDGKVWQPWRPAAVSDQKGRFRIGGLGPGPHRLEITDTRKRKWSGELVWKGIAAGSTDIVLEVPAGNH